MANEALDGMEDAMRTAWSLVRLQWEAAHGPAEPYGSTIVEMLEANGLADAPPSVLELALALVIVGGTLASAIEILEGVKGGLSPKEAEDAIRHRLIGRHADPWPPEDEGPEQ
jgi:hypothetical protein